MLIWKKTNNGTSICRRNYKNIGIPLRRTNCFYFFSVFLVSTFWFIFFPFLKMSRTVEKTTTRFPSFFLMLSINKGFEFFSCVFAKSCVLLNFWKVLRIVRKRTKGERKNKLVVYFIMSYYWNFASWSIDNLLQIKVYVLLNRSNVTK